VPKVVAEPEVSNAQFVKALRDRQQLLVAELEELRRELSELTARIGVREGQLRNLHELLALETGGPEASPASGATTATAGDAAPVGAGAPFLAAAAEILSAKGKPIHYRELAELLAAKNGVYVPGRDPAANLLSHMSRDSRFRRFERGTYGLQHWAGGSAQPVTANKPRRRKRGRKGRSVKP
jgi:HB1, ASXL, restriction endonuclease HTH domain